MEISRRDFWYQVAIKNIIGMSASCLLIVLLCYSLLKFHCNGKTNPSISWLIQGSAVLFMTFNAAQNILSFIQDLSDDKTMYGGGKNLLQPVYVVAFNLFIIFRLYYSFKNTIWNFKKWKYIILIIISILDGGLYTVFVICEEPMRCASLLWIHVSIDMLIAIYVSYLFFIKLFKVLYSRKQSQDQSKSNPESYTIHSIDLSSTQTLYITLIIKHTLLVLIAATTNNLFLVSYAFAIYMNDARNIKYEWILIAWYFEDITLWIKSLCIYLGFSFANKEYQCICGCVHNRCSKACEIMVRKQIYNNGLSTKIKSKGDKSSLIATATNQIGSPNSLYSM